MLITRFDAAGFRNLSRLVLEPHPALTVLTGDNGSGKSSVLEAIYCLATGHTFRTRRVRDYLAFDQDALTLAAQLKDPRDDTEHRCGLSRQRDGDVQLRVDFETAKSFTAVARVMPVKALTPDSHRLIEEGPEERRRFLDWGCFHGSPDFMAVWRRYRRALTQRNEALRRHASDAEVSSWNPVLTADGNRLAELRFEYAKNLAFHVKKRSQAIDFPFHMELEMRSGWDPSEGLEATLEARLETHRRMRTTTDGPHRADLLVRADKTLARQHLSRGQQKVLVHLLHLAQLDCLRDDSTSTAIVLCDDLGAELDADNAEHVVDQVLTAGHQALVTAASSMPAALLDRCNDQRGLAIRMQGGKAGA